MRNGEYYLDFLQEYTSKNYGIMKKLLFVFLVLLTANKLDAQVIYVTAGGSGLKDGTSWSNALDGNTASLTGYTRLAETIASATPGSQVWIGSGTYKPSADNDREKYFTIAENTIIYGGFAGNETSPEQRDLKTNKTVFSGNIGDETIDTDNCFHVIVTSGAAWTNFSTIDGIQIRQGYSGNSPWPNGDSRNDGGGILNTQKLNLANAELIGCYASGYGGAVNNSGQINFRSSLFYKNNAYEGGALFNSYSGNLNLKQAKFSYCILSNNSASHRGGAVFNSSSSDVINCLIVNNSGGGVISDGNTNMNYIKTQIINSTIANNGIDATFSWGSAKVYNSIIWGSTIRVLNSAIVDIQYTYSQSAVSGTGNISSDPLFRYPSSAAGAASDGLSADWRLRWCSPALNMGSTILIPPEVTTDLDGNPRILSSSTDLGAYELDESSIIPGKIGFSNSRIYVSDGKDYIGDGSTWATAVAGNMESCKYPGQTLLYEAMKEANAGTEIWLKAGSYIPDISGNRSHSFTVGNGVRVYGGFNGAESSVLQRESKSYITTLSGNIGDILTANDNSYHVLNINPEAIVYSDSSLVDGLRIEGGYAGSFDGAGVLVNSNTRIKFNDVTVVNNFSQAKGAGFRINKLAKVSITNSTVSLNSSSGIYNEGKLLLENNSVSLNNINTGQPAIYNADSLVLNRCNIESNYVAGGLVNGKYCYISGGRVSSNSSTTNMGGIRNNQGAVLNITGCNISLNTGGVWNDGIAEINNCTIDHNTWSGIYNSSTGTASVSSSQVAFNVTNGDGGGINNAGILNISASIVSNNEAGGYAGGLYRPTLVRNCIIVNNKKNFYYKTGGGIFVGTGFKGIYGSTVMNNSGEGITSTSVDGLYQPVFNPDTFVVRNSVIYGNDIQTGGKFDIANSCIEGGSTANGNFFNDPSCKNPTRGRGTAYDGLSANWNLWPCSPCVNKGSNQYLTAGDDIDAAGNPRLALGTVDMGALEVQTAPAAGECPSGNNNSVLWEIFRPALSDVRLATIVPWNSAAIYSLQAAFNNDNTTQTRIRGYLVPGKTGYFRFYMASDPGGKFYLSSDSTESRCSLICSNDVLTQNLPDPPGTADSIFLETGKPYYFETFCTGKPANFIKIGWMIPGSRQIELITSEYLRRARPKQVFSADWELFKNRSGYNFDSLRTTNTLPDQTIKLDSLITTDFSTGTDHFSSRIRGYLVPPVDGDYNFYFACDNVGQFWLGTDSSSASAQLKSNITFSQTDWTKNTSSQTLVANRKYFFEIVHYDSVYTDLVKLGWKIPGDNVPKVIRTPYILSCGDDIPGKSITFIDREMTAYPNWILTPRFRLAPWNAGSKTIKWESTDVSVATVSDYGIITSKGKGVCRIIALLPEDPSVADTLVLTVTDYYGPYFVKQDATEGGKGHSWDDPVMLTKLLDILSQGTLTQRVTAFVAEGTYKPTNTIDRNKTFVINNIRLAGGFDPSSAGIDTTRRDIDNHPAILSGEIGAVGETIDNSYHVTRIISPSVIDGFTIRDGRASSSTYGYIQGYYAYKPADNGGGIYIGSTDQSGKIYIRNCRITNNSAWNGAGGILMFSRTPVSIINSSIYDNKIQQIFIKTGGGMFELVINSHGAGIASYTGIINAENCLFYGNRSDYGYGKAVYLEGSTELNLSNSAIYNNPGTYSDLTAFSGAKFNINNSTIQGSMSSVSAGEISLKNSTLTGGGSIGYIRNKLSIDNTVWTGFDLTTISDTSFVTLKYSIVGNKLYGTSKNTVLSDLVPNYSVWLDPLADNGGTTPTMKLKKVPGKSAIGSGNPQYLGTTDQRGAIRTDSVSIGAYQYVKVAGIDISPGYDTLCNGESVRFRVRVLPDFTADSSYTISSSDTSIVKINGSDIYSQSPGKASIIVKSNDGGFADTCFINIKPVPPQPAIRQIAFRLFSDALSGNQWYNTEGIIDGATGQNYDPNQDGNYYVKITSGGCSSESSNIVHFLATGVNDEDEANKTRIFPNPFTDELVIECPAMGEGEFEIMNFMGEVVVNGRFTGRTAVRTGGLSSGAYLLKVRIGNEQFVQKIIKE